MGHEAVDKQSKDQTNPPISGLDMGPTIEWYTANQEALFDHLSFTSEAVGFKVQDPQFIHIDSEKIAGLILRFPRKGIRRSRLHTGAIIGKPPLYFSKETTGENIQTTTDVSQALSPTAFIPSYTDNSRWRETGKPSSDIYLYQIPQVPDKVAQIIHAQGLIHEFAHTIVTHALYGEGQRLLLPNGEIVNSRDYLMRFANLAKKHDPISHYSSHFRKPGEEFASPLAIEEEFVETVAARYLGFAYTDDPNPFKRFAPLYDRPEVDQLVWNFLSADVTT